MKILLRKYLLIFVVSFIVMIAICPLRGGWVSLFGLEGVQLSIIASAIVSFCLTFWWLRRYKNVLSECWLVAVVILGAIIIDIPIRIFYFESSSISLVDFIVRIVTPLAAWGCFRLRKTGWRIVATSLFALLVLWTSLYGNDLWLRKVSFGTFSGKVTETVQIPLALQDSMGNQVLLSQLEGDFVVLDFFSSSCGICFEAFPTVQRVYEKYKNNSRVKLYAVHARYAKENETYTTGAELLNSEGYTFPCLSVDGKDAVLKIFEATRYPTVIIYDKAQNMFVFRGRIEGVENFLDKYLDN